SPPLVPPWFTADDPHRCALLPVAEWVSVVRLPLGLAGPRLPGAVVFIVPDALIIPATGPAVASVSARSTPIPIGGVVGIVSSGPTVAGLVREGAPAASEAVSLVVVGTVVTA